MSQSPTASSLPEPLAVVSTPVIVVGVFPGMPDVVVSQAVVFAERFGARLVFVYVDTGWRRGRCSRATRGGVGCDGDRGRNPPRQRAFHCR
ncbi:hypothetical protein [Subtercola sp. RTI3]|uniref:hypothetical protein n=1 Tax=Subtercola sp. RTI3 TaxID=3048639 RepID=UPI0026B96686|nr:hypothetical protein [Subtercola sp. RTI3]MEA9984216.1 hypothetical protein [Subtercola sp. RTI3]